MVKPLFEIEDPGHWEMVINIIPMNEKSTHELGVSCSCEPAIQLCNWSFIVTHNQTNKTQTKWGIFVTEFENL